MENSSGKLSQLIKIEDLTNHRLLPAQEQALFLSKSQSQKVTRPVGVFAHDSRIDFVVWAPHAQNVELQLQLPDHSERISMHKQEWGYWTVEIENTDSQYTRPDCRYGYWLDGKGSHPDPASRFQPEGVGNLSAIVNTDFNWTDADWQGHVLKEMILYELHVGTFTREGTFQAIIDKLDYLLELGITTIELLPVAQFSGKRGWGYDGVFPYAVQQSYGGPDGLKELVNACHQRGMSVILDVVYNHLGPEGNCIPCFGPYLHKRYQQGWGDAINFDNKQSDHVRTYFIENALMWLGEYHIDGLRLDAVHSIWDFGANHFLKQLSQAVKALSAQTGRNYVLIAESDLNDSKLISPYDAGGFGLDAQWLDDFHHALHSLVTGETDHYYSDFGLLSHLQKAFAHSYVYDGIYSPFREKTFGNSADSTRYDQFVVYAQNHDQIGNRLGNDRLSSLVSQPMLKAIAGVCLLSPYVPMLFMGEEYGETNPFFYFIDYSDDELIEAVRKGRKEEFAGFQKDELEYEDPQDSQTFVRSQLSWDFQVAGRSELLTWYRRLIQLRKQHPAFGNTERGTVQSWIEKDQILFWLQQPTDEQGSVLLSMVFLAEQETSFTLPRRHQWKLVLDSNAIQMEPYSVGQNEEISVSGPRFMTWTSIDDSV